MTPSDNSGKVCTKAIRAADGTTVVLTYLKPQAAAMRALVQSIRIKGDRKPSLSLIARRSLGLYLDRLETVRYSKPDVFAAEIAALEKMVTPVPKPRKRLA